MDTDQHPNLQLTGQSRASSEVIGTLLTILLHKNRKTLQWFIGTWTGGLLFLWYYYYYSCNYLTCMCSHAEEHVRNPSWPAPLLNHTSSLFLISNNASWTQAVSPHWDDSFCIAKFLPWAWQDFRNRPVVFQCSCSSAVPSHRDMTMLDTPSSSIHSNFSPMCKVFATINLFIQSVSSNSPSWSLDWAVSL